MVLEMEIRSPPNKLKTKYNLMQLHTLNFILLLILFIQPDGFGICRLN